MTHEGLEANYPPLVEDMEVVEVVRDKTAPEAKIHHRFLRGDCKLLIEGGGRRRRRVGIEGHLEHGRHAAGGGTARSGIPAFPVGAARFVEVDVRVDDARKNDEIPRVDGLVAIPHFTSDCGDGAVDDRDVGRALPGGKNHGATTNDERAHRTSSILISCAPSQSVSRPISGRCSCPSVTVAK